MFYWFLCYSSIFSSFHAIFSLTVALNFADSLRHPMCILVKCDTFITAVPWDSFAKICEKAQEIGVES